MDWALAAHINSERLILEPLTVRHAAEMVGALAAPSLYRYIGGEAPSLQQLTHRYERQSVGHSPDGSQGWLNWVVRCRDCGEAIGFVQATLTKPHSAVTADIAWVIAPPHQGQGMAAEAAAAMAQWLRENAVSEFAAFISPDNLPSVGVARRLGMHETDTIVDGENRWESA